MRARRETAASLAQLCEQAAALLERHPENRDARLLWARSLQRAGRQREALREFERLLADAPANERVMLEQGAAECRSQASYFPARFCAFLESRDHGSGGNAKTWQDYAARDIERGREITNLLRQRMELRGRRVLDVGSGYGAMLVALAEAGAEAVGVEIDHGRSAVGRQRLEDIGIGCEWHEGSITDPEVAARLGRFDAIVCQDVLEHVEDPGAAIAALGGLLRPGGTIFVQVPNKYSAEYILSDHHYGLPGISLLARPQSIAYWQAAYQQKPEHYTVGYLRTEKYYRHAFARAGVKLSPVQRLASPEHVLWFSAQFSRLASLLQTAMHEGLSEAQRRKVRARGVKVAQLYVHACRCLKELEQEPRQLAEACEMIVNRLCVGVWRFLGTKAV